MKNLKHGFTLAEILLCVGIIGVVSAMGLIVSKYSTERAYNMYYYTGYMNLYNALLEAESQKEGQTNQEVLDNVAKMFETKISYLSPNKVSDLCYFNYFAATIQKDFAVNNGNLTIEGGGGGSTGSSDGPLHWNENPENGGNGVGGSSPLPDPDIAIDKTPDRNPSIDFDQGITITPVPDDPDEEEEQEQEETPIPVKGGDKYIQTSNGIKYYYNSEGLNDKSYICLTMEVPQAKTRKNNGKASVVLMYLKVNNISYLIPVDDLSDVKLQERRDLLPVYIDDSLVGRADANGKVTPISYYNYKQVYCAMTSNKSIDSVISCTGVTGKPSANEGVLRVRDPRKAR